MVTLPGRWNWRWVLSAPFPHARLMLRPPLTDRKKLASCGATSDGRRSDAGSGRAPPKSSSSNEVAPQLTLQLARISAVTLGEAKYVAPKVSVRVVTEVWLRVFSPCALAPRMKPRPRCVTSDGERLSLPKRSHFAPADASRRSPPEPIRAASE